MVWEAIFLLVVLKIPLVYLCVVVWWAIRAEPRPEAPAGLVPAVVDTPPTGQGWRRRPAGSGPRKGPPRRPAPERPRRAYARAHR